MYHHSRLMILLQSRTQVNKCSYTLTDPKCNVAQILSFALKVGSKCALEILKIGTTF